VPYVGHALDCGTAVVQAHFARYQGNEVADFGGCGVVKAEGHRSRLADAAAAPYLQTSPILLFCSLSCWVCSALLVPSEVPAAFFMMSAIFWMGSATSGATLSATS
jgi:hypothetical protein